MKWWHREKFLWLIVAAFAMSWGCPQLSEAKCSAVDFDTIKINEILKDVENSKENLAADFGDASKHPTIRTSDLIFVMAAARDVQSEGMLVAYFVGLLVLQADMTTASDRQNVDGLIGVEAEMIYRDLQTTADQLSKTPPGEMHPYGEYEIKEARDVVRKLQTQFTCAADNK